MKSTRTGPRCKQCFGDASLNTASDEVIDRLVLDRFPDENKNFLSCTPTASLDNFFLPLSAFDYSAAGKSGCRLSAVVLEPLLRVVV